MMNPNVGCRQVELRDPVQNAAIPLAFLYPASGQERPHLFGPYSLDIAPDAPATGQDLRLVVLSHGNGGSPWTLRDLGARLVRAGFVVALPEHPGNSRSDNSLAGTAANLENRPRHISLVIDAAYADPAIGNRLAPGSAGIVGLSIGGYTALAVAGGRPWTGPHESESGTARPIPVAPDRRVRALVLLSPATPWFMADGSLADVRVPILMRTGDKDQITPACHAEIVKRGVGDASLIEHKVIARAGHFSFMSEFPEAMTRPDFPPSQDPDGFDRAKLQRSLHADIVEFFGRTL